MILLSIDTCGSTGTVALARLDPNAEQVTLLSQTELPGKTYSARLIPTIRELLAAHNITIAEIATIVVTNGPGSFTGIRIGLSTAKGVARVHSTPILAVSRLAVLAHKSQAENSRTSAAALDASRGEFFFGDYPATPNEQLLNRDQFTQRAAFSAQNSPSARNPSADAVPTATLVAPATAIDALHFALPRLRARDYDLARHPRRQLPPPFRRRNPLETQIPHPNRTMTVTLRPMHLGDLDQVLAIAAASPEAPHWRPSDYTPYFAPEPPNPALLRTAIVAIATGPNQLNPEEIQAFAAASLLLTPDSARQQNLTQLDSIAVHPSARRQGLGATLLRAILTWSARITPATSPSKSAPATLPPSPSTSNAASAPKAAAPATTLIRKKMPCFWD